MSATAEAPKVQPFIILKHVRVAWPEGAYKPRRYEGKPDSPERYGCSLIIEKGSDNDKLIRATIKQKATEAWGAKAQAVVSSFGSKEMCYTEGDLAKQEMFHGHMKLGANRKADQGPPKLVDKNHKVDAAPGRIYGGCYVNAKVDIWCQKNGNNGVRCQLIALQFDEDGDAFGAGGPATSTGFENEEEETTSSSDDSTW